MLAGANYLRSEEAAVRAGRAQSTGRSWAALSDDSTALISLISARAGDLPPAPRPPGATPLTVWVPAEALRLFPWPGPVPHYPRPDRLDLGRRSASGGNWGQLLALDQTGEVLTYFSLALSLGVLNKTTL